MVPVTNIIVLTRVMEILECQFFPGELGIGGVTLQPCCSLLEILLLSREAAS